MTRPHRYSNSITPGNHASISVALLTNVGFDSIPSTVYGWPSSRISTRSTPGKRVQVSIIARSARLPPSDCEKHLFKLLG